MVYIQPIELNSTSLNTIEQLKEIGIEEIIFYYELDCKISHHNECFGGQWSKEEG